MRCVMDEQNQTINDIENRSFHLAMNLCSIYSDVSMLKMDRPNKRALVIINTVLKLMKSLDVTDFWEE